MCKAKVYANSFLQNKSKKVPKNRDFSLVRVTGLEPAHHLALEPKGNVTLLKLSDAADYALQHIFFWISNIIYLRFLSNKSRQLIYEIAIEHKINNSYQ